jgi:hypothetical protein
MQAGSQRLSLPVASFALLLSVFTGCGGGDSGDDGDDSGSPTEEPNVVLTNSSNYTSESTLDLPVVETSSGADLDICWTDIDKDIQCHDIDPAEEIDNVALLRIPDLSEAEIEEKLSLGQLQTDEVAEYFDLPTEDLGGATCTKLSELSVFGAQQLDPAADYVESSTDKYVLLFSTGTTLGVGGRALMFLQPTADSDVDSVTAPVGTECTALDFNADLSSNTISVPADGPWIVGWKGVTTDPVGNTVVFSKLSQLLVAFYEGMTVEELETNFLDIEILATSLYELDIPEGARSADLADAKERNTNAAFPGFTSTDGVWAIGLLCETCQNPAPVFMGVLEPQ